MRMPFTRDEFYHPETAIRRYGIKVDLDIYVIEVEPQYRYDGMPRST